MTYDDLIEYNTGVDAVTPFLQSYVLISELRPGDSLTTDST